MLYILPGGNHAGIYYIAGNRIYKQDDTIKTFNKNDSKNNLTVFGGNIFV